MSDSSENPFLEHVRRRLGDRYEILRELPGGGMSRVFAAREIALDRLIVIKFLPGEIAAEANRERFRREIQVAAKLSHPHIAPLFSAAEDGELLYFTMPYIAGESLRQALDSGRRFSVTETLEILRDVASALAYAHKAGVVHRDIKPGNVLREGDHAVIADFGVAKAVSFALGTDSRGDSSTVSGMAIGTPAYMAPEQIAADVDADHRVDIYAFGLLGYELLTGHAPFRAASPQAVLAAQLTQEPPPILLARNDVPPVLAALLARCLEKDASRRPQSADAVLEVLRALNASSGETFAAPATPRSRNTVPVMAAGVLAIGVLVAFFVFAKKQPPVSAVNSQPVDSTPAASKAPVAPIMPANPSGITADSQRIIDRFNARREQRLLSLLRDSISNAVRKSVTDSLTQLRDAEKEAARVAAAQAAPSFRARDSMMRFMPNIPGMPSMSVVNRPLPPTPEQFSARTTNLGPPRRIGISVYSGIRVPATMAAAGAVRDTLSARVRANARYILIPQDSTSLALARSRTLDSLRTWLNADMWITIYANGDAKSDSVGWNLVLRDFTAHAIFGTQGINTKPSPIAASADPAPMTALARDAMRLLEVMDRAPRRVR